MKRWMGAFVTFVFGVGIGSCSAQGQKSEDTVIVKTKYVDRTVDREVLVKVQSIPASCMNALSLASAMKSSTLKLVGVATTAEDILLESHQAITMKDGGELNTQRDRLYKLEVRNNAASQDLMLETVPQLDKTLRTCKTTKAYKESK